MQIRIRKKDEEELNIRLTRLLEKTIEEETERQDEVPEVEEQNIHDHWLMST